MMNGILIVLEGGDGCGKSTQAGILHKHLLDEGYPSVLFHEPGNTSVGEGIRRLLKANQDHGKGMKQNDAHPAIDPMSELLLFSAARVELINSKLRPALRDGRIVVCDRFTPSTIAYQGYGRGLPIDTINQVNCLATTGLRPNLVILLDVHPKDGIRRTADRHEEIGHSRFEEEPIEFHLRVREGYLRQAEASPNQWIVVNSTQDANKVANTIWKRVQLLIQQTNS
jgi:dTMP kinase